MRIFRGHNHGILPIIFLPSNHDAGELNDFEQEMNIYTKDIVITGSQDTTAKTWSFETGECLRTFQGHIGAILCMAIDTTGKLLFTGSGDHTIRVWDVYRGNELRIYDQHQAAIINLLVKQNKMIEKDKISILCFLFSRLQINYSIQLVLIIQHVVGLLMLGIVQEFIKDIIILYHVFK